MGLVGAGDCGSPAGNAASGPTPSTDRGRHRIGLGIRCPGWHAQKEPVRPEEAHPGWSKVVACSTRIGSGLRDRRIQAGDDSGLRWPRPASTGTAISRIDQTSGRVPRRGPEAPRARWKPRWAPSPPRRRACAGITPIVPPRSPRGLGQFRPGRRGRPYRNAQLLEAAIDGAQESPATRIFLEPSCSVVEAEVTWWFGGLRPLCLALRRYKPGEVAGARLPGNHLDVVG